MVILTLILISVCGQELPTGTEVVASYIKAKGGESALRKTTSYRLLVELRVNGKKTADTEILQAPNRHLTVNTLLDGSKTSHGTDGKAAWYIDAEGVVYKFKAAQLADYLRHYTTVHEALEWPKQFQTIRCVGTKKILGKETYEVRFTTEKGRTVTRFFGVASGLFVRELQQDKTDGTKMVSDISDYRRVNGVLVPHKRTVTRDGQVTEYLLRRTTNNVAFSEDQFTAPSTAPD